MNTLYRLLLRLYPRSFREAYGEEMRALFAERSAAREGVERRRREVPVEELGRVDRVEGNRPFNEALTRPGLSLIGEFKRRSPSAGWWCWRTDWTSGG